jgi:hypothetical protein
MSNRPAAHPQQDRNVLFDGSSLLANFLHKHKRCDGF